MASNFRSLVSPAITRKWPYLSSRATNQKLKVFFSSKRGCNITVSIVPCILVMLWSVGNLIGQRDEAIQRQGKQDAALYDNSNPNIKLMINNLHCN